MPIISCTVGRENFADRSAVVSLQFTPSRAYPGRAQGLDMMARGDAAVAARMGALTTIPAGQGMRADIVGQWSTGSYDVREGAVLRLGLARREAAGSVQLSAAMLLRMRADAALVRVAVILTGHPRATMTRAIVEGRFDILSPQEAAAQLGVVTPPAYLPQFAPSLRSRAFEVVELERQRAAPAVQHRETVTNSDGQEVQVTTTRRRRALDL